MKQADRAWLAGSLAKWETAAGEWLGLDAAPLPQVVAIDADCTYTIPHGRIDDMIASPHGGDTIDLGEQELPLGPISFADGSGRFVMSLPSVWRAAGISSTIDFETFLEGVLLHEIMHTRQAALASAALESIEASTDEAVSDDRIQDVFQADADYLAAHENEYALLEAAYSASSDSEARALAVEALSAMRERRARYFVGTREYYSAMEDVFLTMEGMGQYMMLRNFLASPGVSRDSAFSETLRSRYWTQNEGLMLILVVDRLLPRWRELAFREPDWRAENLLAAAVGESE